MPNAKDMKAALGNISVLLVGPAGTGKSIFCSSAPTPGYVIDTGKEMLSYIGEDFDYDTFPIDSPTWSLLTRCVADLKRGFVPFSGDKAKGIEPTVKHYNTVIIDNLSAVTDIAMERSMSIDRNRDPVGGPLWNVHYKMVTNLVSDLIRLFLEIPNCNRLATAHTETTKDEYFGRIIIDPRLQGRLSDVAPQWFDEVLYGVPRTGAGGNAEYMLQTVNKGYLKARSRISGKKRLLPDYIPNEWEYLTLKKKYTEPLKVSKATGQIIKPTPLKSV